MQLFPLPQLELLSLHFSPVVTARANLPVRLADFACVSRKDTTMSAISSSLASLSLAALGNAPEPAAAAPEASQPVNIVQPPAQPASANTVQAQPSPNLSSLVQPPIFQQVQQLYRDGRTVPQIAFSLDLSAQAIVTYLNISKT